MTKKGQMYLLVAVTLFLAPFVAQAQPWTGAAGAAVIDEESIGMYRVSTTILDFGTTGTTGQIIAYYNLTDTTATGNPPWKALEISYLDTSSLGYVKAELVRITPPSTTTTIASCTSVDNGGFTTRSCGFPSGAVDFNAGYIYIVRILVSRSSTSVIPMFTGVRIY